MMTVETKRVVARFTAAPSASLPEGALVAAMAVAHNYPQGLKFDAFEMHVGTAIAHAYLTLEFPDGELPDSDHRAR